MTLRLLGLVAAIALSLGGCVEYALYPPNYEPTATEDSVCKHVSPAKQQVNCEVAWNKDPALGVICIQSGPRG